MSDTLPASSAVAKPPPASASIHNKLLEKAVPPWLTGAAPASLQALKAASTVQPDWHRNATPAERKALSAVTIASVLSQAALNTAMLDFKDVNAFARPLLVKALKDRFNLTLDVDKTFLRLNKPLEATIFNIRVSTFEVLKLPLLQAVLHNFEASECEPGAFDSSSGFVVETAVKGVFEAVDTTLTVRQFTQLCRSLDIGAQYQIYLKGYFRPADGVAEQALRSTFITAQKDALRVAAEQALLKKDISLNDYTMILSVINGEVHPQLDGRPVWFQDMGVMKKYRLTGCVAFVICEKYRYTEDLIVYVPNDPEHPLKRYTYAQMKAELKRQFTACDVPSSANGGVNTYQRFFSQFVAYADRPGYFSEFTEDAPDTPFSQKVGAYAPIFNGLWRALDPLGGFKELPPAKQPEQVATVDPFADVSTMLRQGTDIWTPNIDLWGYLYDRHRDQIIADAASHAVPTADVDARVRSRKLASLLNIGMLVLNGISMFIPGLGEAMMVVMAGQLLHEAFEGAIEWSEGDRRAAKAHLIDIAENLAMLAVMVGIGKAFGRLAAVKPEPVIERLERVTLPNGKVRLWKPDLTAYESNVQINAALKPNAFGEYDVDGKSYIRLGAKMYEKRFDPQLKQWRLVHRSDPDAYQPILKHYRNGTWRHTLERPLAWDRATLLRRLGPPFETFSDAQLEQLVEVSGVSDDALRKLHIDDQSPPPQLLEMARLLEVDRQTEAVIGQVRKGACVNGYCQLMVPFAVELPNWPAGEVIEVFSGPEPWGRSVRFGPDGATGSVRPTIKITQAQVDAGKLPEHIVAALDEEDLTQLLGSESTWAGADRVQLLRDRLADQAQLRKKALFDNLLSRQAQPDADVQALQRGFPSLSPEAAQHVLGDASAADLSRLRTTGRIPLSLAKAIRVHLHQSSLSRALAGLSVENLASPASDRLALHTLERLPGWSADTRVEVRSLGIRGPLVDSIGSDQASTRYYLIKRDDYMRAMDAEGKALNSVPKFGHNLFESLLDVLPEPWRRSLQDNPSQALQKQVTDYAYSHRDEMSRILARDALPSGAGRLLRRPSGGFGYAASGDVAGFADEPLIAKVRDICPLFTDQQALAFIRERRLAGDTDQQVFHMLQNRKRELEGLTAALDAWVDGRSPALPFPLREAWPSRRRFAERIIFHWRMGFYRGTAPERVLDLLGCDALPPWVADFSHVSKVRISAQQLNPALRQRFSALRSLDIYIDSVGDMPALAHELPTWNGIRELSLELQPVLGRYSPALTQAVQGMTQLERLRLTGSIPALDYSALTRLRTLSLAGNLSEWPTGLMALDELESLDLTGVNIRSLPDALFSGHERLWRGLRLNLEALAPRSFMRAFEYVHENPAHLVDEPRMVEGYCRGRLAALVPQDPAFAANALAVFGQDGLTSRALLDKVGALHEEYRAWDAPLVAWQGRLGARVEGKQMPTSHRQVLADRIRECWRDALAARYVPNEPVAGPSRGAREVPRNTLDLTGYDSPGDLPALGNTVFPQIRRLNLSGAKLAATGVDEFLSRFPQLRELNLHNNRLTELPQALETLGQLTELNLSYNQMTITAATQARLSRLTALQRLDLSNNRVGSLNVTSLADLRSLNLGSTQTREWPDGVLTLTQLGFLDLSHSGITSIPDAVLTARNVLLAGTSLKGCRLTPQAIATAQAFAHRTRPGTPLATMFMRPFGIEREVLAAGRTGGDPMFFPAEVSEQPDLLFDQPTYLDDTRQPPTFVERLQRLDPQLGLARAVEYIDTWLADGVGAIEIENALTQWQAQHTQLIEGLNRWIDVPAYREGDVWVSATDRRRAAERLLACWRETLRHVHVNVGAARDYSVDLSGLILGDLPALPVTFPHVGALDLSSVRLSLASDPFLLAFPRLNRLSLNANRMGALPDAVTQCAELTRLALADNALSANVPLQHQLLTLPQLQVLDLRGNSLDTFDVTGLDRLQSLDLSDNRLSEFPTGVLGAPALTTLNLRNNYPIEVIPPNAFLQQHAALMAGTDLSDNLLREEEFIRLREYQRQTGRGLGFTAEEIDRYLAGFGPDSASDDESIDVHPGQETAQVQKNRWFQGVAADSEKHRMWEEVMAKDTTGDFAEILAQLRETGDFRHDRVDLVERVWAVLEAAYADPVLRQRLMLIAKASRHRTTCGDGRILLFNQLEVEVYEFNALRSVDPTNKGRALLKLSRGLFRLSQVEEVASERIRLHPGMDAAEIRLALRIGLAQRLELPRQPRSMLHAGLSGVTQADLDAAYTRILARESTPVFMEQLTARGYWEDYLQEKYPAEFARVQQAREEKSSSLEDQYPDLSQEYLQKMEALKKANEAERQALMVELSTREIATLGN